MENTKQTNEAGMKTFWTGLYTAQQTKSLLSSMCVTAELPSGKQCLLIDRPENRNILRITKSKFKGTDGRLLFMHELQRWVD